MRTCDFLGCLEFIKEDCPYVGLLYCCQHLAYLKQLVEYDSVHPQELRYALDFVLTSLSTKKLNAEYIIQ